MVDAGTVRGSASTGSPIALMNKLCQELNTRYANAVEHDAESGVL
jgi:hypothetical protein